MIGGEKYFFTEHAQMKMKFYGLSKQRVHRVIRAPFRTEEGIIEKTVACMQPTSTKLKNGEKTWGSEIWVMYQLNLKSQISNLKTTIQNSNLNKIQNMLGNQKQIRIISAWRYPGVSPRRNPVPEDILREIREEVL